MPILVSDTSVIIDLERGQLLEPMFALPFEFAVPDLLFERELAGPLGEALIALGLRVEELQPAEVTRAIEVIQQRRALSVPDSFAYALAEQRQWTLLTGDGALRQVANQNGLEIHGVLWICDRFEEYAAITLQDLHAGLSLIGGHPRCRLPAGEITTRLQRYAETLEG